MNFTLNRGRVQEGFERRDSHLYGITGVISQPITIGKGIIAFGGYFRYDLKTKKICDGQLVDGWGQSDILNFGFLDDKLLKFDKQYKGRGDIIHYTYVKDEKGLWEGFYDGKLTGAGETQCKIYLADKDAFTISCGSPKKF